MSARVGVLISGRGSNMMALVEQARGYEVVLVASDKPGAAGLAWASERSLRTFALSPKGIGKAAYEAQLDAALRDAGVEVIALAGYMRLLPAAPRRPAPAPALTRAPRAQAACSACRTASACRARCRAAGAPPAPRPACPRGLRARSA